MSLSVQHRSGSVRAAVYMRMFRPTFVADVHDLAPDISGQIAWNMSLSMRASSGRAPLAADAAVRAAAIWGALWLPAALPALVLGACSCEQMLQFQTGCQACNEETSPALRLPNTHGVF